MTSSPPSTSSRSRWPPSPMRARVLLPSTPAAIWPDGVPAAAAWFLGANDAGQLMWDPETGGGFDGLHADGVNRNQGAESTLAADLDFAARSEFLDCVAMTSVRAGLVTRSPQRLAADPSRVITRLFVPGQEGFELQDSRSGAVLRRILALDEDEVRSSLDDVVTRFDGRHRDLVGTFRRHAGELADRLDTDQRTSPSRECCCWERYSPTSTPSRGRHCAIPAWSPTPYQAGTAAGSLRFVMSVRGIGRGAPFVHRVPDRRRRRCRAASRSTTPTPFASVGAVMPTLLDAAVFRGELARLRDARRGRRLRSRCARRPVHPSRPRRTTRQASDAPEHPWARPTDHFTDSRHRRAELRRRIPQ